MIVKAHSHLTLSGGETRVTMEALRQYLDRYEGDPTRKLDLRMARAVERKIVRADIARMIEDQKRQANEALRLATRREQTYSGTEGVRPLGA